jgi:hypothetical protein
LHFQGLGEGVFRLSALYLSFNLSHTLPSLAIVTYRDHKSQPHTSRMNLEKHHTFKCQGRRREWERELRGL